MISYGNINRNKSYAIGILGALLGGLVCSLPYLFLMNFIGIYSSLLFSLVTYGVIKGYRLFNGRIDNNMRKIVIIVTIICISLSALLIKPLINVSFNFQAFLYYYKLLYLVILREYVFSLIFGVIGLKYTLNRFYI